MEKNKIGIRFGSNRVYHNTRGNCIYITDNVRDRSIRFKLYGIRIWVWKE